MQRSVLAFVLLLVTAIVVAQTVAPTTTVEPPPPLDYVCPMHPDVRSAGSGKCPRCGMGLALGIPDPVEYPLELGLNPRMPRPDQRVDLVFRIKDPKTGAPVKRFEVIHEKLFHMFIVSQDLNYFVHDHPVPEEDGGFRYRGSLPKAGMYRAGGLLPGRGHSAADGKNFLFQAGRCSRLIRARIWLPSTRKHGCGIDDGTCGSAGGSQDDAVLSIETGRGSGAVPWSLGAHAGGQRRSDRFDPHSPIPGRRRAPGPIQRDLSPFQNVPHLGSISEERRGQYGGVYGAGIGVEIAMRRRLSAILACATLLAVIPSAHDVITTKITYSREISRLVYDRCARCHRPGGAAFSLTTYAEARPWAAAIKEEVLERRMPPWGAVKGFGEFKDDQGLTQEQIELIADWVEGGAPEGDPKLLPRVPSSAQRPVGPSRAFLARCSHLEDRDHACRHPAANVLDAGSVMVTATRPDGSVEPLLWLYNYQAKFPQTYWYKGNPPEAATRIEVMPPGAATMVLVTKAPRASAHR